MNKETPTLTYIGAYSLDEQKPLRRELVSAIKGIGLINVMEIFTLMGIPYSGARSIKLMDLDENMRSKLCQIISKPYFSAKTYASNRKDVPLTEDYKSEIFFNQGSLVFLGEYVSSHLELSKKRLIKLKCNIGNRLKLKQKVHGQRTKSTGRKTKCIKGFQKKKKLQREVERR